jgi:DNA-binding NarL/FixJ family response regulator
MDKYDDYGALSEYSVDLIEALIEALIQEEFLEKTPGMYPMLGLTSLGEIALTKEKFLKEAEEGMQQHLHMRVKSKVFKPSKTLKTPSGEPSKKTGNYTKTLELFNMKKTLADIAAEMGLTVITIESHILKLYGENRISLAQLLDLFNFDHLKTVKKVIEEHF